MENHDAQMTTLKSITPTGWLSQTISGHAHK
jgi:hypothetical protein